MENPYATNSPNSATSDQVTKNDDRSLQSIARKVFLAWEKLRVVYVFLLAAFTLVLAGFDGLTQWSVLRLVVEGAIVANVAYFAGPVVETYVRWLGYDRTWPRWVMFVGGTLLSMGLALVVLSSALLPAPN